MPPLTESERIKAAMLAQHAHHLKKGGKSYVAPSPARSLPMALPCVHGGTDADILERCPKCNGGGKHVRECEVHGKCTWEPLSPPNPAVMNCQKCRREGLGFVAAGAHPNIIASDEFARAIPPYPEGKYSGRGVVICGGGKYWPSVLVTVRMLRWVGCELPVQVWYLGDAERDDRYKHLLAPYGVEAVDALAHPAAAMARGLAGFEGHPPFGVKSFAVMHSPFEEVLSLDADCYTCQDPTEIFTESRYKYTGGVFWPDLVGTAKWTKWADFGVQSFGPACGWEVGQYVLHKRKAWRPLNLARWYDDHGDWCYGWGKHHEHGDKHLRVAWARFQTPATFYATQAVWKGVAFLHPGPNGVDPMFVHRSRSKFTLASTHFPSTPQNGDNIRSGLPLEEKAFQFLDELREVMR